MAKPVLSVSMRGSGPAKARIPAEVEYRRQVKDLLGRVLAMPDQPDTQAAKNIRALYDSL